MGNKIAYVMSRFPHLPETFILREMNELERQGWEVALYPLILQSQAVIHAEAQPWLSRAHRLPYLSPAVLGANAQTMSRQPWTYLSAGAQVVWENKRSPNFFARALLLFPKAVYAARLMEREGITHVHAHYATHPALVAWLIHRLTGITYSLTAHAHDIFVRKAMLATKLREASFIVTISQFNRAYLAQTVGAWVQTKTHIVHCGITPATYAPREGASRAARFELINIGSLQPYKGQRYLIQACALLREQGIPFRCRIVGEGAERPHLERMIAAAGLNDSVELLGALPQEQVARLLPTAHCYVQPSIIAPSGKMEGIPVALMEALACALPVVATALSGIPELVREGETGWLVPPADPAALAEALAKVWAEPERSARLAGAGRDLVLREFDLQTNVQQLSALFTQVIQARAIPLQPRITQFTLGEHQTQNRFYRL